MNSERKGLSWRAKLLLLLTLFSVVPVLFLAYWVFEVLEDSTRESRLVSLEGLATAKAGAIDRLTNNRTRDVERIASLLVPRVTEVLEAQAALDEAIRPTEALPALHDAEELPQVDAPAPAGARDGGVPDSGATDAAPARPIPPRRRRIEELRRERRDTHATAIDRLRRTLGLILWDQAEFEELLVIETDGRVIASTFSPHEGRSAADIEYFRAGARATFVQPVFLSPITERHTMMIATPIRDPDTAQVIGVLAARLNLRGLFALINETTGLGETGETIVGKAIEDELIFMAPTRHDPDAALAVRYPVGEPTARRPMVQAALGRSGSDVGEDYRGQQVLAAWRPIPALGWGLVVKIDEDEAMRGASHVRTRTLQISLALLGMAVLASILLSRELVRPLRQLKQATDRISRGDLGVRLEIRSADEIGELADSFDRMVAAIKFFREHARTPEEDQVEPVEDLPDEVETEEKV